MKHSKLRKALAFIISIIVVCGIIALIFCTYHFHFIKPLWLWLPLALVVFVSDCVCGLIMFNSKRCSDELKAFWLFIILILPLVGCIFWLFLGVTKQVGYGLGKSSQITLLSHIFNAKKSIKIYTNSWFISYDTFKALNYASLKNVKVDVIISIQKRKRWQNLIQYNINKFLEPRVHTFFSSKDIVHNFIIIDDKEVLFNDKNFNYKYMYSKTKIYLAENIKSYTNLWNKDFIKTTLFDHNQNKPIWTIRMKYGLENIFYPFY